MPPGSRCITSGADMLDRALITGLVLAGGRGSRMGGVDKGLQLHAGVPLALHAIRRLMPQVGTVMLSANRHLDQYAEFGVPVWPDDTDERPGPLAGFLSGLTHCATRYLVTVPCDAPNFPTDLVTRLATELIAQQASIAIAATRAGDGLQLQPVFCLMTSDLQDDLRAYLQSGQRQVERWATQHHCATVLFDEVTAFANANTPQELQQLQQRATSL